MFINSHIKDVCPDCMSTIEIRRDLNAILDYSMGYFSQENALNELNTVLKRRLEQLHEATTTAEGMRLWSANLENDLQQFTEKVGHPHYTGGDPYGGERPELVQNPKNIMIDFVNRKINACIKKAGEIRGERQHEDMALRQVYTEGPPAHVPTPSSKNFDDCKRECEKILEDIRTYSYKNTESQNDTHALYALQSTCFTCRNHSLYRLNVSHKLFTGNTADILRNFKAEIETAQRVFKSVVGDTQYDYTDGPHTWHEGPDKTLRPGAKNEMLAFVDSKIHYCLFYVQCMIDIKSAEERTATHPTNFDDTPHMKMLLQRLQSYSF